MKDRIVLGLFLAGLYSGFVLFQSHKWPLFQGVETDFYTTYIPQCEQFHSLITGEKGAFYPHFDSHSWAYHGVPYPALLNLLSGLYATDAPVQGYQYFQAAKIISVVSGAALVILTIVVFGLSAWPIAILICTVPIVFAYSCGVGTDMISAVLCLWALYFAWKGKHLWIAGLIFTLAVGIRHEYLVLLPIGVFYHRKSGWKQLAGLIVPIVILLSVDGKSWNSYLIVPHKYLSHISEQDVFPPQMYTESDIDTVENYYTLGSEILRKNYGSTLKVFWQAGWNVPKQILLDLGTAFSIIIPLALSGLIGILLFLRGRGLKYLLFIVFAHMFMVTVFGVFSDRYYLFDIVLIMLVGLHQISLRLTHKITKIAIFLLLILSNLPAIGREIDNIDRYSSGIYVAIDPIVKSVEKELGHRLKLMSTRGQPAFVSNMDWQPFPKNLRDLYGYCLRFKVDFVIWGGMEEITRSEWRKLLRDPQTAYPQFLLCNINREKNPYLLYYVNKNYASLADSTR